MAASSHQPERRRTSGPVAARDDWIALRRAAGKPADRVLHDMNDGLARLDRRLQRLKKTLEDTVRAT